MGLVKPARGWRVTDDAWDDIYRRLEGLWLFNEGSGTIVADASGHGRHGVASSSVPWAPSPSGGMWRNNSGTFRRVDVGGPTATWFPLAEFTMVMSVMVVQAPNSSVGFMGLTQAGPLRAAYIAWSTSGPTEHKYRVGIYSDTGASAFPAGLTDIPPVGTMTSVALVYRGTSCELWLQGQLAAQNTLSGTRFASSAITSPLWLGAWTNGTAPISSWYNAIDWAALWSRALSAQEVRRLHEQPPWMVG